jgi:predicted esterase
MQPHFGNPISYGGAEIDSAPAAMILVHGRGASPAGILDLFDHLDRPQLAAIAPAAAGGTWYPYSFMAPREQNEPGITSALFVLESLVRDLLERGYSSRKIMLLGFSQGACLSSEFVLRHPRRYGGLMALSGGLIGPPGTKWDNVTASLEGTPVFLGCSDIDPHIPLARVIETDEVFRRIGADVERRIYPGMPHTVTEDEIAFVQRAIDAMLAAHA